MSKFCHACGAQYPDEAVFCSACGARLAAVPGHPQPPQAPPIYQNVVYVKPKIPGRGFGIASMVLGIVGLVYSFSLFSMVSVVNRLESILFAILFLMSMPILALCFSFPARKRGYKNGISTSGLVLGTIALGIDLLSVLVAISMIQ